MEFFSRDAGQARRNALQNALAGLTDYIPPELRPWLGVANELNPVTSLERAGTNALAVADPNVQGWDKVAAVGDTVSNMANALAPVVMGSGGAVPAANAVEEALMGWSASSPMAYAARDFVTDEFGGVGFGDEVASRGAQIMDMLRSGRGADVTDDMLDMGDPTLNARLNEWLFNNYDLPMDAASRAARARGMGFDGDLYHGTGADFPAFYDVRRGNFFTDKPEIADIYASGSTGGSASIRGQASNAGANYIPVKLRGPDLTVTDKGPDGSHGWLTDNIAASVPGVEKFPLGTYPRRLNDAARNQGYGAIRIDDMLDLGGEQTQWMSIDPSGIRSRFARFDPRLSHLRNLSAVGAGLAIYEEQQREEAAREYLRSIGAL